MNEKPDRGSPKRTKSDWLRIAQDAIDAGRFEAAKMALHEALRHERRSADLNFNLGQVEEHLGDFNSAAHHYAWALRLAPRMRPAALNLSRLLVLHRIAADALDGSGLKAALALDVGGRQAIVAAALHNQFSADRTLSDALAECRDGRCLGAARNLVLHRTHGALTNDLVLDCLRLGTVCNADQERLFTALRRVLLLHLDPERFQDRAVTELTLALIQQCWNNDFAWLETPEETEALAGRALDFAKLQTGDIGAARALMMSALYRPLRQVLNANPGTVDLTTLRPKRLKQIVATQIASDSDEQEILRQLPRLKPISDAVSLRVAEQYEGSPYPRWHDLQTSSPGILRRALQRYFPNQRLAFMDQPFDLLVAGAGTGQHALQAALDYGAGARTLAIDISAPSLAFAERQRRLRGVQQVQFMVADILDAGQLGRQFDVIECVGTLHHMADAGAGLRALTSCLKPHGIMYLGFYSATARKHLAALRSEPRYPGAGCSDSAARAFRADLLTRPDGASGAQVRRSPNFWNLNEFRDLALHEQEIHLTLPQIGQLLQDAGLTFRGFTLDQKSHTLFQRQFPASGWPGTLSDWDAFEAERPTTFAGMYCFYCEQS